jgi:DNA polymerase I-like protein with 3'-5' exonuclease and polymerase domains
MSIATRPSEVSEVLWALRDLGPEDSFAIDTESTGLGVYAGKDRTTGISIAIEGLEWYLPVGHEAGGNVATADLRQLGDILRDTPATWIFHNALGVDWIGLERLHLPIPRVEQYHDTQIESWLSNENDNHQLKWLGGQIFGLDAKDEQRAMKALRAGIPAGVIYKELRAEGPYSERGMATEAKAEAKRRSLASKKDWDTFTAEDIGAYAAKDARLTYDLAGWYGNLAYGQDDPTPDRRREHQLQYVLHRMMKAGVRVDLSRVEVVRAKNLARMAEIQPLFDTVNLNSAPQLQKLLYVDWDLPEIALTPTGRGKTDRETLEMLERISQSHHPFRELMEYKRFAKSVGTYYDAMLRYADDEDRVHTNFNSARTVTGRFSSSNPNLQNIPRSDTDPLVKSMFRPTPGYELWEFDLSQAELRVWASLANDRTMMRDIEAADMHSLTADSIFGDHEQAHRQLAKNLNYGVPYGIGPKKFASYLVAGTGRKPGPAEVYRAREIIAGHRDTYPQAHRLIKVLSRFAEREHFVPLHKPGRFRRFRGMFAHVPSYHAISGVVQGGVAELMKDVMLEVEPVLDSFGMRMVLQVHDSLWIETPPKGMDTALEMLEKVTADVSPFRMEMPWDSKQLGVK